MVEEPKVEITNFNSANVRVKSVNTELSSYAMDANVDVDSTGNITNFNGNVTRISDGSQAAYFNGNGSNYNFNFYGADKAQMCDISGVVADFLSDVKEYLSKNPLTI